ncbi:OmpA family protein [Aquicoccus sp. SU-CL01552]|uniref:OmpA family protein n=1 Tax=Aquicoccus sp. SU-CL01552 TaxID=3127656 RepID=UPI0031025BB2
MNKWIAGLGLTLALGACAQTWGPVPNSFLREAGAQVDTGQFGNATLNNTMIMNGEKSYIVSLANRFAEEVPSTITFAFDSAHLDAAARAALSRQADWIRQFPEVRFRVYGHTDAVGSDSYNRRLGQRRANAAVAYLVSRGINRRRLEAVVSYGERQPLIVTQGRERRNRRTVTEVSGFLKRHPSVMDGKYAQVIYREYVNSAVPPTALSDNLTSLSE